MTRTDPRRRFDLHWVLDPVDGCHLWVLGLDRDGYGQFKVDGRTHRAHRWLFYHEHGFLPPEVLHDCDVRRCVNERHLLPGTKSDNMRDMIAKGRGRGQFGSLDDCRPTTTSFYPPP